MADPIEVHYTPDGDDWTVTVKGRGQTLTGTAVGLIAARDRADQLVEKIAPDEPGHKTVVHLLGGDAVEFTTAYLTARLAKPEPEKPVEVPAKQVEVPEKPVEVPAPAETTEKTDPPAPADPPTPARPQKPTNQHRQPADQHQQPADQLQQPADQLQKPAPAPRADSDAEQPPATPAEPQEAPANSGT